MKIERLTASSNAPLERIYIVAALLKNFKGHKNVEAHIFRADAGNDEIEKLRGLDLVGEPDPETPTEILAGATSDAALECLLESFTVEECDQLVEYLGKRYGDQIEKLTVCPIILPVPLGVGPLAKIPESATSGFINFDHAKDYPLPFKARAYYEL